VRVCSTRQAGTRRIDGGTLTSSADNFGYTGKRAIVVGGASGIGAATVDVLLDLGAQVIVMDIAQPARPEAVFIRVDLREKLGIEAAVGQCGGPVDALVSCAGVADPTPNLPTINFIGQRHLIEYALDSGLLPHGSAIAMVSSAAGRDWREDVGPMVEYVTAPSFEAGQSWIESHPQFANYRGSKQAVNAYVARNAYGFGTKGVRINSLMPGLTDTPLARANADRFSGFASEYRAELGYDQATATEQALILAFLCSDAARRISGESILSENGHSMSMVTGSWKRERLQP
jgi:NAD(P)-dependent dehydrogenase (short-subunit alcohol dehydrogenase family)